ncbi:class A beta-lactamase [Brevibacterium sp. ZH18]|uniref:class A beta-lactamase n=1 Tax=Brevibacterium sp. ZH18 TaxID=2927784 RepID=UPI001F61F910|nr:class A beta-lactamase [Brevibacterium sp. ZH18]MCI4010451.1 class A beta-lactamase [Brevibacterium sp. ZH18]
MKPQTAQMLGVITVAMMTMAGCTNADDSTEPDQHTETSTPSPSNSTTSPRNATSAQEDITSELTAIEDQYDARVGVHAMDTSDGSTIEHRSEERFGFASTIKSLAVAELLARTTPEDLDEQVTWTKEDVEKAGYAPVTKKHLGDGLPLEKVAEAAIRVSDNAAANIVFDHIDGPKGLDLALEDLGDSTTEVVDREPDLNTIDPGKADNITTPAAFSNDLAALLDPDHLSDEDRTVLIDWMSDNETGDPLIRAGAPAGWKVADKSGHADALRNDVAIVFPPKRDPIVIAIMTENNNLNTKSDAALIEDTARAVLAAFE